MSERFSHQLAIRTSAVVGLVVLFAVRGVVAEEAPQSRRPNVLFIAVDDLRPQLGCYGHGEMITPSLDRLANQGRRFDHHYVQVPTCGASRCAMLTGQYPSAPGTYDNNAFETLSRIEDERPITLPQLFRKNGYTTIAIGKIGHLPDSTRSDGSPEMPFSWDEAGVPLGQWKDGWSAFFAYQGGTTRIVRETPVSERADVPDEGYPDGLIANAAIAKLKELESKDRPFFLAVGFFKPHLPFNAPAEYWDLYDPDKLPSPRNPRPPAGVDPSISLHKSGEMRGQYTGFSEPGIVSKADGRHLRHAYAACVSYADAQVGRVLDELERLGLSESTIVIVWGDHGWHLGEQGIWGKHTLHEVAMRSPLIVRMPHMSHPGRAADGLVESVDIYPTLVEVCGMRAPPDLAGKSFAHQLEDPSTAGKPAVFGFWRGGRGHSIRSQRYRLVLWSKSSDRSQVVQTELYDLKNDPDETENVASEHPKIVDMLSTELRKTIPLLNPK